MMAESVLAWSLPLDVDVVKIHFNHNTGSTSSDGITIQEDETTIVAPEWYPLSSKNEESAYLKTVTSPTVKAEFYANDIGQQGYSSVRIYAHASSGWALSESNVTFPGGGSGQVSFGTSASFPQASTVGKWTITWTWKVVKIDGGSVTPFSVGTSTHTFYNVLDTPEAPMTVPWVEVLDYACDWAQGETTEVNALTEITEGINAMGDTDGDINYDVNGQAQYTSMINYEDFDLTDFFSDINTSSNVEIACNDSACLFNIFTTALGCSTKTYRRWNSSVTSITKMIDIIGVEDDFNPQDDYSFGLHQFGWFSNKVFDPLLQLYNGSDFFVPCNETLSTFESALLKTNNYIYGEEHLTEIVDN